VLESSIDGRDPVEHSKDAANLKGVFDVWCVSVEHESEVAAFVVGFALHLYEGVDGAGVDELNGREVDHELGAGE